MRKTTATGRRLFRDRLKEDLKDPVFAKAYEEAELPARIAIAVAQLREKEGITQKQLAREVGVKQQVISRLEDPEKSNMTLATLNKVALALGKHLQVAFV